MSEKNITARVLHKYDTTDNWDALKDSEKVFVPGRGELVVYADNNETPKIKIGDGIKELDKLPFVSTVKKMQVVAYPGKKELYYNGKKQKPQWEYDPNCMYISSEEPQSDAGKKYITTFNLIDGYCWSDNTTYQYSAEWTINKVNGFTIDTTPISLSVDKTSDTIEIKSVNYEELSNLTFDAKFIDTSLTCEIDEIFTITLSEDKKYLNVEVAKDFDYSEEIGVNISLTLNETNNFLETTSEVTATVETPPTLDSMTWQEIQQICADGNAESYFKIGDMKKVDLSALDGWHVNTEALKEVYVFIIGFNHNKGKETPDVIGDTIHFSGFKKLVDGTYYDCAIYPESTDGFDGEVAALYLQQIYNWDESVCPLRTWLYESTGADGTNTMLEALEQKNKGISSVLVPMQKAFNHVKVYISDTDPYEYYNEWYTGEYTSGEPPISDIISILDGYEVCSNLEVYDINDDTEFHFDRGDLNIYDYYNNTGNSVGKYDINKPESGAVVPYGLRSSLYNNSNIYNMAVDSVKGYIVTGDCYEYKGIVPVFCVGKQKEN